MTNSVDSPFVFTFEEDNFASILKDLCKVDEFDVLVRELLDNVPNTVAKNKRVMRKTLTLETLQGVKEDIKKKFTTANIKRITTQNISFAKKENPRWEKALQAHGFTHVWFLCNYESRLQKHKSLISHILSFYGWGLLDAEEWNKNKCIFACNNIWNAIRICSILIALDHCVCFDIFSLISVQKITSFSSKMILVLKFDTESGM